MASTLQPDNSSRDVSQLTQIRVPLERAAEAFATRDENGRIPIVVIAERGVRVPTGLLFLAGVLLLAGLFGQSLFGIATLSWLGIGATVAILALVAYTAVRVRIPEGMNAMLARAGKYVGTIGSGLHLVPPWVAVTHLITRREIPFTVPVQDAPTQDNVRALVQMLITFTITEPNRFVFNISADDFDLVLFASCQNEMRRMIRGIASDQINDLPRLDLSVLRQTLSEQVSAYGITIMNIRIVYAQPPADFMQSQEARQLAAYQELEQEEVQALAVRRQSDLEALALQRALANEMRERDVIAARMKKEEARKELATLEARVAEHRLQLLEERLKQYPVAANWERMLKQLAVMRTLAGNSRTIVQLGNSDGLLRAVLMEDMMPFKMDAVSTDGKAPAAADVTEEQAEIGA